MLLHEEKHPGPGVYPQRGETQATGRDYDDIRNQARAEQICQDQPERHASNQAKHPGDAGRPSLVGIKTKYEKRTAYHHRRVGLEFGPAVIGREAEDQCNRDRVCSDLF